YKGDMERVFKINEEIICFETTDELKKLIEYYLRHRDERVEIAEAAYRRVIKEHTYDIRSKEILEILKARQ
ncbi:MAG: glycosyltransferase, partial [Nitrospirota bacterium]